MRLIRLTLEAFGPFAERVQLEFDALPPGALFLIHGPTGAGKTTLLDGITFALYGSSSGGEREEFVSHFAHPGIEPFVELEFSLGPKHYRVRRSLPFERPKARGAGTTRQPAKGILYELNGGDATPLDTKLPAINTRIQELLHLNEKQFRQIVLLPQGKFRELLSASTATREDLLRNLFEVEDCRELTEILKQQHADAVEERKLRLAGQAELLKLADVEDLAGLEAQGQALELDLERRGKERERAEKAGRAALEALRRAEDAESRVLAREAALAHQTLLVAQKPVMDALRSTLGQHRLGAALGKELAELKSSRIALGARRHAVEDLLETAKRARAEVEKARLALEESTARLGGRAALMGQVATLEAEVKRARAFEVARAACEAARKDLEAKMRRAEEHAQALLRVDAEAADLQRSLGASMESAAGRKALEARVRGLQRTAELESESVELTDKLQAGRRLAGTAKDTLSERRVHLEQLEQSWAEGGAVLLAQHLEQGDACPVCGSHEHPHLARGSADGPNFPDASKVSKARSERERAHAALHRVEVECASLEASLESNRRATAAQRSQFELDGETSVREQLADLQAELEAAHKASAAAREMGTRLTSLEEQRKKLHGEKSSLEAEVARAREELARLEGAQGTRADEPGTEPLDPEQAVEQLNATRKQIERLEQEHATHAVQAEESRLQHAKTQVSLERSQESLQEQVTLVERLAQALELGLSRANLKDEPALEALLEARAQRAEDDERLAEFDQACLVAAADVKRTTQAAAGASRPDLEACARGATAASKVQVETRDAWTRCEERLKDWRRRFKALEDKLAGLRDLDMRVARLQHLVAVADGLYPNRGASFERYVLACFLDDVLRSANVRLRTMSGGRFELLREQGQTKGTGAKGLDLAVSDAHTGTTRAANSLSGGEGFLASLSLALGLADIVQAESGGRHLETLFVDEGFGTLDPETLDMALATLVHLSAGRRRVGLISHVPELRAAIPHHIRVHASPSGSHVEMQ